MRPGHRAMLIIFLAPFIPMVLGQWFFDAAQHGVSGPAELIAARSTNTPAEPIREMSNRVAWFGAALIFLLVETSITAFTLSVLWRSTRKRLRSLLLVGFAALSGLYLIVLWLNHGTDGGLSRAIFELTWNSIDRAHTLYPHALKSRIGTVIGLVNVLAVISLASCWIGSASLAGPPISQNFSPQEMIRRLQRLRSVIFATGLLLVMGVLHMSVWLRWGLSMINNPEDLQHAQRLVQSITGYWGLVFSATAIAGLFPLSIVLRRAAQQTIHELPESAPQRDQLKDLLNLSSTHLIVRVATVMAPAVIGQASGVLEVFATS